MTQTLEKFIAEANTVFPDGFILSQYRRGPPNLRPLEILAQFVVSQISELHDPRSSDRENLRRIATNLGIASAQLEAVATCFEELHGAALS